MRRLGACGGGVDASAKIAGCGARPLPARRRARRSSGSRWSHRGTSNGCAMVRYAHPSPWRTCRASQPPWKVPVGIGGPLVEVPDHVEDAVVVHARGERAGHGERAVELGVARIVELGVSRPASACPGDRGASAPGQCRGTRQRRARPSDTRNLRSRRTRRAIRPARRAACPRLCTPRAPAARSRTPAGGRRRRCARRRRDRRAATGRRVRGERAVGALLDERRFHLSTHTRPATSAISRGQRAPDAADGESPSSTAWNTPGAYATIACSIVPGAPPPILRGRASNAAARAWSARRDLGARLGRRLVGRRRADAEPGRRGEHRERHERRRAHASRPQPPCLEERNERVTIGRNFTLEP